jgi:putative oxidoreductase
MNLGLLVLRLVVGLLFVGHGAQKLWGSFGGHGVEGTGASFESMGLRPGRLNAIAAGVAEICGGVLLALGLLTPLGAALLSAVMWMAMMTAHRGKGVWVTEGGIEYNLVLLASVFAVTAIGPGKWSLDYAIGIHLNGAGIALVALAAGLFGALLALAYARSAISEPRITQRPHRAGG